MERLTDDELDRDEEAARLDGNYMALRYMREVRALRQQALTQEEREALEVLADRNRCVMFGTSCTDALCAETQAGVAVLDKLLTREVR
jgi:hypothetical protein